MATSVQLETEGDSREFVEQNPDKAVKLTNEEDPGPVYQLMEDGEFTVLLGFADGHVEYGPIMGDTKPLDGYDVEIVDADEVPSP